MTTKTKIKSAARAPKSDTKPTTARKTVTKTSRAASRVAVRMATRDAACLALIERDGGATVAEIRQATGWKGPIQRGPDRIARKAGKRLVAKGDGEARTFRLA